MGLLASLSWLYLYQSTSWFALGEGVNVLQQRWNQRSCPSVWFCLAVQVAVELAVSGLKVGSASLFIVAA